MKSKLSFAAAVCTLCLSLPVHAQFSGLTSMLGGGKSNSAPAVDSDSIKKSVTTALINLAYANGKYAEALGKENEAAQFKEIGDKLTSGSLGANSDVITQIKTSSAALVPEIKQQLDNKTKLSEVGKKAAQEGLVFHVKGTADGVQSSKMLKGALESKSPMVLAALAGMKDFPGLLAQWTSTTGSVISYMKFNGLDVSQADKANRDAMDDKG